MAKLWDMGYSIDPEIERFTDGEDCLLDRDLAGRRAGFGGAAGVYVLAITRTRRKS